MNNRRREDKGRARLGTKGLYGAGGQGKKIVLGWGGRSETTTGGEENIERGKTSAKKPVKRGNKKPCNKDVHPDLIRKGREEC